MVKAKLANLLRQNSLYAQSSSSLYIIFRENSFRNEKNEIFDLIRLLRNQNPINEMDQIPRQNPKLP